MHQISLTSEEAQLVIAALQAVTPTGGGSPQLHLGLNIRQQTGEEVDYHLSGILAKAAYQEIREAIQEGYLTEDLQEA